MKKLVIALPLLIAVAACNKAEDRSANAADEITTYDAAEEGVAADSASLERAAQPPKISANVAPGVAFDYRYDFAMPAAAISEVQSRHADLCEKLGIVRCRVTGMQYKRSDDGEIIANLGFKVDPAIAHSFGRDATDIVETADGRLADSQITGEDAGSDIVATDKSIAGIDAELARIDAQLKIPALSKEVRSRLVDEAEELRATKREKQGNRDAKVESLATTPMVFNYSSSETLLGFDNRSPVNRAAKASAHSFMAMIEVVLTAFGALAPWALLGGGIWWLVRRLRAKPVAPVE